jgi:hypothetical protein
LNSLAVGTVADCVTTMHICSSSFSEFQQFQQPAKLKTKYQMQGARRFLSGSAGTGTGTVSGCRNCRNLPELPVLGGCNRRFSLLATH